jgi:hypothetical protein
MRIQRRLIQRINHFKVLTIVILAELDRYQKENQMAMKGQALPLMLQKASL